MPSTSFRYHGYTIHVSDLLGPDLSGTPTVTYQSPFWPSDPRIVKAPSVETAKRWIREECHRATQHPGAFWFLKKIGISPTTAYRIVDQYGHPLAPDYPDIRPFKTVQDARDYAESQGFALFEHFNY